MAINSELAAIYGYVGGLLSGRDISFQLDPPAAIGAKATISRDGDRFYIRMIPDLLPGDRLKIFLHEIAHARLHHDTIPSSKHHEKPTLSIPTENYTAAELVEEYQANKMANYWFDYARAHRSRWLDPEIALLKALAQYAIKNSWQVIPDVTN